MWNRVMPTVLGALLVASLVGGAASGQEINTDYGVTERSWISRSSPGTDLVVFAWIPELSVFEADLFLVGECYRADSSDEPVGTHRAIFNNIELVGVDSGNTVDAVRISKRIRNGIQKQLAVWGLTDAARAQFSGDRSILVAGEIRVTKRVEAWDVLTCGLGVMELFDPNQFASAVRTGTFEGPLMPAHGAEIPRLLRIPGRAE